MAGPSVPAKMNETRAKVFQTLKQPCVEVSRVALGYTNQKATGKDLIKSLELLHKTLQSVTYNVNRLDAKLADYAFYPLSLILKEVKNMPLRVVEITVQNLQILIDYGWKGSLSSQLGEQLLMLLSFLAGGNATNAKVKNVNEELGTIAFQALTSLFRASKGILFEGKSLSSEHIPIFGHTVTVTLDGITGGPSAKIQLAASSSLNNLIDLIRDDEALKNVFPGIVSSLTRVLSSRSGHRTPSAVLELCLEILTRITRQVLGDEKIFGSSDTSEREVTESVSVSKEAGLWATATAGQVRMALANILPLRYHERFEVKCALSKLCKAIIQHCRRSLSQTIPMLTETLISISSHEIDPDETPSLVLNELFDHDIGLCEILKSSIHDWIVALPRVMHSNDDMKKRRIIDQISTSFRVLGKQELNLDVLYSLMATNLRASVAVAITNSSKSIEAAAESSFDMVNLARSSTVAARYPDFEPVLFGTSSNKATTNMLHEVVTRLQSQPVSVSLQQGIADSLRTTTGQEQMADLWLCLQGLKKETSDDSLMDQYLNLPPNPVAQSRLMDDVYAFSLDVLSISTFEDEDRWKLQCLALEAVALTAQSQRHDFRPELVDALYPILERLGSSNAALQRHAVTCLNIVARACEYSDAAALIVDNADYLVNAVALKLNTFDISPQAPQVLVMMVRLTGGALIPYLDDLVDSIFSILACYHGYPKLVESLFSVLNAIVEEAATSSSNAITSSGESSTYPQRYHPTSITDLASILRSNLEASTRPLSPPSSPPPEPSSNEDPNPENTPTPPRPSSPIRSELSKTETLVNSIAYLTPAHLTTPSPPLRAGILTLLVSALPILSNHTDTFLPLVANLWPAITARLYDAEPYVTLAATNALTTLCTLAGDFVSTRVEDEWPRLCKLYDRLEKDMREEVKVQGRGGKGHGMRWKVWDAMVGLVICVVDDVGVSGEMEDGVFEMLGGLEEMSGRVRGVLGGLNADALWLVEERWRVRGGGEVLRKPEAVEGFEFEDLVL